jgi:outer membrane lipoprotein SlyB
MKPITALLIITLLTGCATYRPVIDTQGTDPERYNADLRDCQTYAQQIDPAQHAAAGAVAGAVIGALLAAALGGRGGGYNVGRSAAGSAVIGATAGTAHGAESQITIIRRCMAGRGYRVLN